MDHFWPVVGISLLFGGYGLAAVSDIRSIAKPAETRK